MKRLIDGFGCAFESHMRGNVNEAHAARRHGSLAVETAVFIPFFLVAVLLLGYLVRVSSVQENVFHAATDEVRRVAAAGVNPIPAATLKKDLANRILEDNTADVTKATVTNYKYRLPYYSVSAKKTFTDLIAVSVNADIKYRLPQILRIGDTVNATVLGRAWVGSKSNGKPISFDDMEKDDNSPIVWVFPRAGEKYHKEDCRYIKNEPREKLLSSSVRSAYSPCKICKPEKMPDGTLVYCFPTSGKAYHLGSCSIVTKYVIDISEEDAKKQGYTACKVCGGA